MPESLQETRARCEAESRALLARVFGKRVATPKDWPTLSGKLRRGTNRTPNHMKFASKRVDMSVQPERIET